MTLIDETTTTGDDISVDQTPRMRVRKRNGSLEPVDINRIVNAIAKASEGLMGVDPMRVATRTISGLADGATTTVAGCVRRDRLDALRAAAPGVRAGEAFEAWLRRECRGVRESLDGAMRDGAWLASGPLRPGIRVDDRGRGHEPVLGIGHRQCAQASRDTPVGRA